MIATFVPWILNGKAQQEWIWAHPLQWIAVLLVINTAGVLVGTWLSKRRNR